MGDQKELIDFVSDPKNTEKAVEGSMDKRKAVMSDTTKSVDDELRDLLFELKDAVWCSRGDNAIQNAAAQQRATNAEQAITQLFTKQLEEAEIRARLEEVTYWHKRTIREAPYPSQIARTLHEQEDRIAALTQDTKGGTDEDLLHGV